MRRTLLIATLVMASMLIGGCPSNWEEMSKEEQAAFSERAFKGLAHFYVSRCGEGTTLNERCAVWHDPSTICSMANACELPCAFDSNQCAPCAACDGLTCIEGTVENDRVTVRAVKDPTDYSPKAFVTDTWTVELNTKAKFIKTSCAGIDYQPNDVIQKGTTLTLTVPVQRLGNDPTDPTGERGVFARICKIEWEMDFTPQTTGTIYAEHFASNWKSFQVKDPNAKVPPFEIATVDEDRGACVGWIECQL